MAVDIIPGRVLDDKPHQEDPESVFNEPIHILSAFKLVECLEALEVHRNWWNHNRFFFTSVYTGTDRKNDE